jgi:hypothetical protein
VAQDEPRAPAGINTKVASPARVYDYWLGGKDNFPADRAAGDAMRETFPGIVTGVRMNRAFLGRAVTYLTAEAGDQAVPRHRHGPAHGRQHPRGGPAGRAGLARDH